MYNVQYSCCNNLFPHLGNFFFFPSFFVCFTVCLGHTISPPSCLSLSPHPFSHSFLSSFIAVGKGTLLSVKIMRDIQCSSPTSGW